MIKRFAFLFVLLLSGPAWAFSPEGTVSNAPGGSSIVSTEGTWTWGASAGGGNYVINLNGSNSGATGTVMEIAQRGHAFFKNAANSWSAYQDGFYSYPFDPLTPPVIANIHNAPGWTHSHTYTQGQRVNNGPGWNEGGSAFVPYSLLRAYQLLNSSCTSAASGGPTGTASDILDGSCHWKYLSDTDYVTFAGWAHDAPPWTPTNYTDNFTIVASGTPLHAWQQTGVPCNSTQTPAPSTSDGCNWVDAGPIIYSSGNNKNVPPQTVHWNGSQFIPTFHICQNYEADLWNDREYVLGSGNETFNSVDLAQGGMGTGSFLVSHSDRYNDALNNGPDGALTGQCGLGTSWFNIKLPVVITAAPGESFADTASSLPLTGYDQSRGVGINGQISSEDNGLTFRRLQATASSGNIPIRLLGRGCNSCTFEDGIIESHNAAAIGTGTSMAVYNSLLICHSADCVAFDYPGIISHSTLVNPEGTGDTCLVGNYKWNWDGVHFIDSACFGFTYAAGGWYTPGQCVDQFTCLPYIGYRSYVGSTPVADGTLTNVLVDDTHCPAPGIGSPCVFKTVTISNTTYSVDASTVFVAWPGDYRLKNTSPLKGAGADFASAVDRCPIDSPPHTCPSLVGDGPDAFGTARNASVQDVGFWQSAGSVVPAAAFSPISVIAR